MSPPVAFILVAISALSAAYWAVGRAPARWRAAVWTIVIVVLVVPWANWQDHAHWERAAWVPFESGVGSARDVVLNVLLYLPLGLFSRRHHFGGERGIVTATLVAVALSILTEWTQVYSHGRFPTATDVAMNGLGGFMGALLARRRPRAPGHV